MYYYKRKTSPLKWIIVVVILIAMAGFGYWYYVNYFSKIDFSKPNQESLNINQPGEEFVKTLAASLAASEGDVQANLQNKGYEKALLDTILRPGDQLKTGLQSNAIIKLENGSILRLGENTEIALQNLAEKNILIEQFKGRTYHNISQANNYQIKYANVLATALGTKFEFITNPDKNYVTVLDFENKVKVEILDNQEMLLAVRLDPNEKALLDLNAAKKDRLKIDKFDLKNLEKAPWYKWNFDADLGLNEKLIDQEPDFSTTTESLELAVSSKDNGVYLSWSIYNLDDFKGYKIVRSEKNTEAKFSDNEVIKSSSSKELNSYLDSGAEKGKNYYYRICVVKTTDKIVCGNLANIELAQTEKDMVAPAMPLLSGEITVSGVNLNWTPNTEEDFGEYRVLKSLTNSNPTLPAIGYLAIKNKGQESYLDKEVNITSVGNVYYRVCSLDVSGNSACSNVVTVENGKVK